MRHEFIATRHNGKEAVTLYMLYAQAANEEPLDFDIYGFRIRYVPELTCKGCAHKESPDPYPCCCCSRDDREDRFEPKVVK